MLSVLGKCSSECPKAGGVFLQNHNDSLMFGNLYSYFLIFLHLSTFAEAVEDILILRATHCISLFCFKNSRLWSSPYYFFFFLRFSPSFFYWIISLSIFQMLSPFQVSSPQTSYPHCSILCFYEGAPPLPAAHLLPPTSQSWHPPTLRQGAFTGPRASPTDAQQGHPLLHMQLEPWCPLWLEL